MDLNITDPEQIKQLISALQKLLPDETDNDEDNLSPKIKTKSAKSFKKRKNSSNKFISMPEMKMHKDDCLIDKKLAKLPPTPRTRKFQPMNVKCRICGKSEEINPNILADSPDRYKCNKCSTMAGG